MKTYTKRQGLANPVDESRIMQRTLNRLRGGALIPKGVHRFTTMKEADQWMTQQIAATHARLKSKT